MRTPVFFFFCKPICHSSRAVISYCPFSGCVMGCRIPQQHVVVFTVHPYSITLKWPVTVLTSISALLFLYGYYFASYSYVLILITYTVLSKSLVSMPNFKKVFCPLPLFFARGNKFLKCMPCTWDSHFPPACNAFCIGKLFALSSELHKKNRII